MSATTPIKPRFRSATYATTGSRMHLRRQHRPSGLGTFRCPKTAHDGNGNVRALVKADAATPASSGVVERYAYDGFGREIPSSTPVANRLSPFAFSTKYLESETGMNYYGYRYYASAASRWINRDPIAEKGGRNLYEYASNDATFYVDIFGQKKFTPQDVIDEFDGDEYWTATDNDDFGNFVNDLPESFKNELKKAMQCATWRESKGNGDAKNPNPISTAKGMGQLTNGTAVACDEKFKCPAGQTRTDSTSDDIGDQASAVSRAWLVKAYEYGKRNNKKAKNFGPNDIDSVIKRYQGKGAPQHNKAIKDCIDCLKKANDNGAKCDCIKKAGE